jgi:hypothetical protein
MGHLVSDGSELFALGSMMLFSPWHAAAAAAANTGVCCPAVAALAMRILLPPPGVVCQLQGDATAALLAPAVLSMYILLKACQVMTAPLLVWAGQRRQCRQSLLLSLVAGFSAGHDPP